MVFQAIEFGKIAFMPVWREWKISIVFLALMLGGAYLDYAHPFAAQVTLNGGRSKRTYNLSK